MPKGSGRPFNKPERKLADRNAKTRDTGPIKGKSIANVKNNHRDSVREMRRSVENVLVKTGLAPYVRGSNQKTTKVKKKDK